MIPPRKCCSVPPRLATAVAVRVHVPFVFAGGSPPASSGSARHCSTQWAHCFVLANGHLVDCARISTWQQAQAHRAPCPTGQMRGRAAERREVPGCAGSAEDRPSLGLRSGSRWLAGPLFPSEGSPSSFVSCTPTGGQRESSPQIWVDAGGSLSPPGWRLLRLEPRCLQKMPRIASHSACSVREQTDMG